MNPTLCPPELPRRKTSARYKNALEKYLGKNSIDELDILLRNNIQEMNNNTKKLYENFKNLMTT